MGVVCQILINKKKEGHKAGDVVTGAVKYALDKPTEYKAVTLSFLGTGKCHWTERSKDKSKSYYGLEEYVTIHLDLLNKKTDTAIIDIGSYECPFEFQLPEDVPSSFKDYYCTISYCIQLKFIKPKLFSISKTFVTEIPVSGYNVVESTLDGPIVFGLEKKLMKVFSAEKPLINLKAVIANTCFLPGENIPVSLEVTNDTDITPLVKTNLYCYTIYTADCGKTKTSIDKIKNSSSKRVELPERGIANLSQTIPTCPEHNSFTTKVMKKEYRLKVTVRLPMPRLNAVVEMPIVIGDRKGTSVDSEEKTPCIESTETDIVDAPPSYWEVMCEDPDKRYDDQNELEEKQEKEM